MMTSRYSGIPTTVTRAVKCCGLYTISIAVLVVKDSWSSGTVIEGSSHLLLDGIQTDTGGVVGCVGMSWCPPPPHW